MQNSLQLPAGYQELLHELKEHIRLRKFELLWQSIVSSFFSIGPSSEILIDVLKLKAGEPRSTKG